MLGNRIKELRKAKGLSLRELSNRIDISVSFLSDIENERSNPSLDRLKDIAKGLGTTVSYLIGETENIPVDSDVKRLLSNSEFREVLEYIRDFDSWSEEDKKELLYYLKAKRLIRNY